MQGASIEAPCNTAMLHDGVTCVETRDEREVRGLFVLEILFCLKNDIIFQVI